MSKKLVAYFSANGNTARVAKILSQSGRADLYEIRPAVPYTQADLDWQDKHSRSSLETNDALCRPPLADTAADFSAYDVIFLGFPVWWYSIPAIIRTFVETYDLSGKVIVPFATSGSSGMGYSRKTIQKLCPGAKVQPGKLFNTLPDEAERKAWMDKY